jgi:hypothetical protein
MAFAQRDSGKTSKAQDKRSPYRDRSQAANKIKAYRYANLLDEDATTKHF